MSKPDFYTVEVYRYTNITYVVVLKNYIVHTIETIYCFIEDSMLESFYETLKKYGSMVSTVSFDAIAIYWKEKNDV